VSLAREAVAIVAATDNINAHAEALVNLSELLRADGEEAEADGALKEAVRLYEEKGNLLGAERARNALLTTERAGL
jgi:hypothetical protein